MNILSWPDNKHLIYTHYKDNQNPFNPIYLDARFANILLIELLPLLKFQPLTLWMFKRSSFYFCPKVSQSQLKGRSISEFYFHFNNYTKANRDDYNNFATVIYLFLPNQRMENVECIIPTSSFDLLYNHQTFGWKHIFLNKYTHFRIKLKK